VRRSTNMVTKTTTSPTQTLPGREGLKKIKNEQFQSTRK
jgi:hypothetical protein